MYRMMTNHNGYNAEVSATLHRPKKIASSGHRSTIYRTVMDSVNSEACGPEVPTDVHDTVQKIEGIQVHRWRVFGRYFLFFGAFE